MTEVDKPLHPCPDCEKMTDRKRCRSCTTIAMQARQKAGLGKLKGSCVDCGGEIQHRSVRCNSCNKRRQWENPAERQKMVQGKTGVYWSNKNRHCIDCGQVVQLGSTRCRKCSPLEFWKRPGHRERVSLKTKATFLTADHLYKLRKANPYFQKGAGHPNYKGNQAGRASNTYLTWQKAVFLRDWYKCAECGSQKDIQAHHIQHWSTHPDQRFDVDNGLTLCHSCHCKKHNGWVGKPPAKKWKKVYRRMRQSETNLQPQSGQMSLF